MSDIRVAITGSTGQLGYELLRAVPAGLSVTGLDRQQLDLSDAGAIRQMISSGQFDCVINAAAYTSVDKAEEEIELAYRVNRDAVAVMADSAARHGVRLVHVSTDYVFDGCSSIPYMPDSPVSPQSVYGSSKLEGEQMLAASGCKYALVRTSWVYSAHGRNFVKTMLRLMNERDVLSIVDDQTGCPTWAGGLGQALYAIVAREIEGIFHWSDKGSTSWYGFACQIYQEGRSLGLIESECELLPVGTSEYPTPAARPAYSLLDCESSRAFIGLAGENWEHNLRLVLTELSRN